MTDQGIRSLPKMWVIGGDGALGDYWLPECFQGYPSEPSYVKILMLDIRLFQHRWPELRFIYHAGGYDMNQFGGHPRVSLN